MAQTNTNKPLLVHFRPDAEGGLPVELWEQSEMVTAAQAIKDVLERPENYGQRPEIVDVSETEFRYPNGTPMCVQRFRIEWGAG
jgi:hypothetical protein